MGTVTRLARYAQVHTDSQMGTGKRPSTIESYTDLKELTITHTPAKSNWFKG